MRLGIFYLHSLHINIRTCSKNTIGKSEGGEKQNKMLIHQKDKNKTKQKYINFGFIRHKHTSYNTENMHIPYFYSSLTMHYL